MLSHSMAACHANELRVFLTIGLQSTDIVSKNTIITIIREVITRFKFRSINLACPSARFNPGHAEPGLFPF